MALQLFVKRKAKDTRLYKIMNQPVNTQPIGQIILRCVSIPICFSVNENQGKARCMFTKERNVKISLRRESTRILFPVCLTIYSQIYMTRLNRRHLEQLHCYFYSLMTKKRVRSSHRPTRSPTLSYYLQVYLCITTRGSQLTILTLILLILAYKLSLLISGHVALDPKRFYLFTPIRFVQCVTVKLLLLDFNVDHKSSDTSA